MGGEYTIDTGSGGSLSLNIIVCIKWVPNTQAVRIDPETGTIVREGVPSIVNPPDLNALELALKIREEYGGRVTVISMAPPSGVKGLEHAIGMGADKGVLLSDRVFAGADTLATSYTLARAIRELGSYDLIVMGQETIDSSTAHIGAQVASWLNIPYIYYVLEVKVSEDKKSIIVKRVLEDSYETYELQLPALISVASKSNLPRRVSLYNKVRFKLEKPVEVWSNEKLKLSTECIGLSGSPTRVYKIEGIPRVERKCEVFKGGDEREAAKWILEKLVGEGVLKIRGEKVE